MGKAITFNSISEHIQVLIDRSPELFQPALIQLLTMLEDPNSSQKQEKLKSLKRPISPIPLNIFDLNLFREDLPLVKDKKNDKVHHFPENTHAAMLCESMVSVAIKNLTSGGHLYSIPLSSNYHIDEKEENPHHVHTGSNKYDRGQYCIPLDRATEEDVADYNSTATKEEQIDIDQLLSSQSAYLLESIQLLRNSPSYEFISKVHDTAIFFTKISLKFSKLMTSIGNEIARDHLESSDTRIPTRNLKNEMKALGELETQLTRILNKNNEICKDPQIQKDFMEFAYDLLYKSKSFEETSDEFGKKYTEYRHRKEAIFKYLQQLSLISPDLVNTFNEYLNPMLRILILKNYNMDEELSYLPLIVDALRIISKDDSNQTLSNLRVAQSIIKSELASKMSFKDAYEVLNQEYGYIIHKKIEAKPIPLVDNIISSRILNYLPCTPKQFNLKEDKLNLLTTALDNNNFEMNEGELTVARSIISTFKNLTTLLTKKRSDNEIENAIFDKFLFDQSIANIFGIISQANYEQSTKCGKLNIFLQTIGSLNDGSNLPSDFIQLARTKAKLYTDIKVYGSTDSFYVDSLKHPPIPANFVSDAFAHKSHFDQIYILMEWKNKNNIVVKEFRQALTKKAEQHLLKEFGLLFQNPKERENILQRYNEMLDNECHPNLHNQIINLLHSLDNPIDCLSSSITQLELDQEILDDTEEALAQKKKELELNNDEKEESKDQELSQKRIEYNLKMDMIKDDIKKLSIKKNHPKNAVLKMKNKIKSFRPLKTIPNAESIHYPDFMILEDTSTTISQNIIKAYIGNNFNYTRTFLQVEEMINVYYQLIWLDSQIHRVKPSKRLTEEEEDSLFTLLSLRNEAHKAFNADVFNMKEFKIKLNDLVGCYNAFQRLHKTFNLPLFAFREDYYSPHSKQQLDFAAKVKNIPLDDNESRTQAICYLKNCTVALYHPDTTNLKASLLELTKKHQDFFLLDSLAQNLLQVEKNYGGKNEKRLQRIVDLKTLINKTYLQYSTGKIEPKKIYHDFLTQVKTLRDKIHDDFTKTHWYSFFTSIFKESALVKLIDVVLQPNLQNFSSVLYSYQGFQKEDSLNRITTL